MPFYANTGEGHDIALAPTLKSLSDLTNFELASDPLALLQSTAGAFAPDMARIFPDNWAWAALAVRRSDRQIWFAVLSGLKNLPEDCTRLRCNLLLLDTHLMLRLRFGGTANAIHGIVTRIVTHPLARKHYDELSLMLSKDPTLADWFAGQQGEIDTAMLSNVLDARRESSGLEADVL